MTITEIFLKFHPSFRADPVKVVLNPGEPSWVSNFTASGGSKGDNTNLLPLLSSLGHLVPHVQGATRVTVASSLSSSSVDTDNSGSNYSVDSVTVRVADDGTVLDHPEDRGDSSSRVRGFSPPSAGDQLTNISSVASRGHTGRSDVVVEVDW